MSRQALEHYLNRIWYGPGHTFSTLALLPLSWLFCALVILRRTAYRHGLLPTRSLDTVVIVVGNLNVGGGGKTPLVIALARLLKRHGFRPGVISSGYGGSLRQRPCRVRSDSLPAEVGDEAVLLARSVDRDMPVYSCSDRVEAARALLQQHRVDVIISDDGLQHYRLGRDLELLVVDAERRFGNGRCLPAGPLREPQLACADVDAVIEQVSRPAGSGFWMCYETGVAINLLDPERRVSLASMTEKRGFLVAGLSSPEKFFTSMGQSGLRFEQRAFADHHAYRREDLAFAGDAPVLMTDKDAVKCEKFAVPTWWRVPLRVRLAPALEDWIVDRLGDLLKRNTAIG